MTSIPHSHHDWVMRLFAVQKFEIIDLNPKSKRFPFLLLDFYIPYENTVRKNCLLQFEKNTSGV